MAQTADRQPQNTNDARLLVLESKVADLQSSLKDLSTKLDTTNTKFDAVNQRLDTVNQQLASLNTQMTIIGWVSATLGALMLGTIWKLITANANVRPKPPASLSGPPSMTLEEAEAWAATMAERLRQSRLQSAGEGKARTTSA